MQLRRNKFELLWQVKKYFFSLLTWPKQKLQETWMRWAFFQTNSMLTIGELSHNKFYQTSSKNQISRQPRDIHVFNESCISTIWNSNEFFWKIIEKVNVSQPKIFKFLLATRNESISYIKFVEIYWKIFQFKFILPTILPTNRNAIGFLSSCYHAVKTRSGKPISCVWWGARVVRIDMGKIQTLQVQKS